ncbi:MAG: hypothetical protein LBC05_00405 [Endomicrobium sp.]|jgi:hypothetical protein|nr:hypothetical protein [Endomicrobium sp.]
MVVFGCLVGLKTFFLIFIGLTTTMIACKYLSYRNSIMDFNLVFMTVFLLIVTVCSGFAMKFVSFFYPNVFGKIVSVIVVFICFLLLVNTVIPINILKKNFDTLKKYVIHHKSIFYVIRYDIVALKNHAIKLLKKSDDIKKQLLRKGNV